MALDAVFSQIFNMSLTGSVVILCVLAVRLLLKKAPKKFTYALWAVVLFRLLCPVSLPAPVSVLEVVQPEVTVQNGFATQVHYLPAPPSQPAAEVTPVSPAPAAPKASAPSLSARDIAVLVWAAGAAAMMGLSVYQYLRLKHALRRAVPLQGNVYLTGSIPTPFVLGIFQPKIYLPTGVTMAERPYILAHERCHIRRCDHILKLLAYGALCLHWFNPLVWVAFLLAGKDMEMSCDEAVIRQMGPGIRADYAAALLRLSTGKPILAPSPLAFGEGNTKGRIIHMSQWKKPKIWVSVLSVLVCIAILTACAVNPQTDAPTEKPSVSTAEPTATDSKETTGPADCNIGAFHFALPEGMSMRTEGSEQRFYAEGAEVGGLALRREKQAAGIVRFSTEWEVALGVPEASDTTYGYMADSSTYADYETNYFPDMPANRDDNGNIIPDETGRKILDNTVTHYFFLKEADVYDLWLYDNRLPNKLQETLLKSCYIEGVTDLTAMQEKLAAEAEALAQCKGILEQIQSSGGYQIHSDQHNTTTGPNSIAPNDRSQTTTWSVGKKQLSLTTFPESNGSSLFGGLRMDGKFYTCGSTKEWREVSQQDWLEPWLATFQWDESIISYQGTLSLEDETSVMLRIDQPYKEGPNQQPHYFVSFCFTPEGKFLNAFIQTNLFTDNATTMEETVMSLDAKSVEDAIADNLNTSRAIIGSAGSASSPYFSPPAGFTLSTQNSQTYTIKKGDQVVGGLSAYPIPDTYDPTDRIYLWLERSGISDFGNPDLFYNGGITSGEGWSAQFSKADSDHKSTARYHIFFIGDDMVQDFWLEYDKLRDDERSDLIHGLSIPEQPKAPDPDSSPEAKAYYVCSQLIEEVSESEWRIQGPVEDKNGDAMVVVFTNDNGLQLRLNMTPVAQAKKYLETEEPRSILNGYKMNKSYATYLDTVTSSEGVYYQFRMNAMYADQPGYEKEFYGDFYFDSDQETFQRLELTVHPGQENELRITEIVE